MKKKQSKKKQQKNETSSNEVFINIAPQYITPEEIALEKKKRNKELGKKAKKIQKQEPKKSKKSNKKRKQQVRATSTKTVEDGKKKIKFVIIFIIVLIFIGVLAALALSPVFDVNKINVIGNNRVGVQTIINESEIAVGDNIFLIDKNKAISNIKNETYIKSIKITRILPDTIVIEVQERETELAIDLNGNFVYIDGQGYVLEHSTERLNIPFIKGVDTKEEDMKVGNKLSKSDARKISMAKKILSAAEDIGIKDLITAIDISNPINYIVEFGTKGKVAYLGDCSNLSARMIKLKGIMEHEEGKEGKIFVNMDLNEGNPYFREKV